ncbi:MBL fold metallo-hydrolase [Alkalilimnicola sp. S0819]|uniref:MBL fold metallo-hydrolase n=1 Tax=Alkalilimnicola sp. S0819 TaxID=2613922 RepID=UPI001261F759|nr:MBL fold metallo-hydrolase [Alkalilimnicola sp. S0819]KAB7627813.1 MBL fold metallo-hydrolase [Alkalilimnicola sp. S0819]MPQ15444.1 MBL fold metallo-hydrolase [Alkalilimnicola sp. S0819]
MKLTVVPVTPFQQNCSIVVDEASNKAAVIDPGGDLERILAAVAQTGAELEKILLTHGHIDHVGAVGELVARTGLAVEGPQEEERFWLDRLDEQGRMFGFAQVPGFTPDRWLNDGDTVTVGETTLEVLHCPGHTPGHVVFFDRAGRLAWVGDVLFKGSIGRTDFPLGDHETLVRSIREKLFPLGDDVRFVPGHGPMSTFGEERASNPFVGGRYG